MRVLHLGKFYPPASGGIERFTADLAEAQTHAGHAVHVLAHADPGTWTGRTTVRNGVTLELAACPAQVLFAPISPGFLLRLERSIRRFRPDVLHLHVPNTSAFFALASPAARRVPWVVQWHSDVLSASLDGRFRLALRAYAPFERRLLARAHRVVVSSQSYLDASPTLAQWRDRCAVIPLGIPESGECGTAPLWPDGRLRVLCVGRFSPYKGQHVLIDALAQVPDASAILVGDGPCRTGIERRISELGLGGRVKLTGQINDADLLAAYETCDLVCLPSLERSESFGLVLLEAMRAARPVVASAVEGSGMRELVDNHVSGLQVPPGEAGALADALRRLADDPDLRRRLGVAGQQRWANEFRIGPVAARMQALYESVLR